MLKSISPKSFKLVFYPLLVLVTVVFLVPVPEQTAASINDKLMHGLVFFVLAGLLDRSYPGVNFFMPLALCLAGYGLVIEILQGFSGYRTFSLSDLAADILGVCVYGLLTKINSST